MAWSRFEEKVIRDMAELFPDLAERLTALLYRIVDLLPQRRKLDHVGDKILRTQCIGHRGAWPRSALSRDHIFTGD